MRRSPYVIEDKVNNPVFLYDATKKSNELFAHAYAKLYGIPATGLRFFTVYGPAGRPGMAYFGFTDKLVKGETIEIFSLLLEKFKKPGKHLGTITFSLFDHIGEFNTMMHSLSSGNLIVTLENRSPEEVCRMIEKYHVELLPTSPTFIDMILLSHAYERYDLSSLKMITYGTERMPESTLKSLHKILPNVRLKQTYGLSEVGIMSTKSESSESLYMKIGGDRFETKIEDDILYVRAKSAMKGYLNALSPFDEEGWFNTKDKIEQKDGYIKILGDYGSH